MSDRSGVSSGSEGGRGETGGQSKHESRESEKHEHEGPLAGLAERVRTGDKSTTGTDPFEELIGEQSQHSAGVDSEVADELFEHERGQTLDSEMLWDVLQAEADEKVKAGEGAGAKVGVNANTNANTTDREIRNISKRAYCHQCEYFEAPPNTGCRNDGTEILELIGLDQFRVADCPVVRENERLEQ